MEENVEEWEVRVGWGVCWWGGVCLGRIIIYPYLEIGRMSIQTSKNPKGNKFNQSTKIVAGPMPVTRACTVGSVPCRQQPSWRRRRRRRHRRGQLRPPLRRRGRARAPTSSAPPPPPARSASVAAWGRGRRGRSRRHRHGRRRRGKGSVVGAAAVGTGAVGRRLEA